MTTTTTLTARANGLGQRLGELLVEIHAVYAQEAAPALDAAMRWDFEPGRRLIDCTEGIARVCERIVAERTGAQVDVFASVVSELVDTAALDDVLEDLDPERERVDDDRAARLSAAGLWTEEDEAYRQLDLAERRAQYPEACS